MTVGRTYTLVHRERGIFRWAANDNRTGDRITFLTRWGAERWISNADARSWKAVL